MKLNKNLWNDSTDDISSEDSNCISPKQRSHVIASILLVSNSDVSESSADNVNDEKDRSS
jgi:hypothetical protein